MRKAIAIDFDGCLCTNAYPEIGEPNWPVIKRAQAEQRAGAGLILWTCREDQLLLDAIAACEGWGLTFDGVNESLPDWIDAFKTQPRKVSATEYWDDKAVRMPAAPPPNERLDMNQIYVLDGEPVWSDGMWYIINGKDGYCVDRYGKNKRISDRCYHGAYRRKPEENV